MLGRQKAGSLTHKKTDDKLSPCGFCHLPYRFPPHALQFIDLSGLFTKVPSCPFPKGYGVLAAEWPRAPSHGRRKCNAPDAPLEQGSFPSSLELAWETQTFLPGLLISAAQVSYAYSSTWLQGSNSEQSLDGLLRASVGSRCSGVQRHPQAPASP